MCGLLTALVYHRVNPNPTENNRGKQGMSIYTPAKCLPRLRTAKEEALKLNPEGVHKQPYKQEFNELWVRFYHFIKSSTLLQYFSL